MAVNLTEYLTQIQELTTKNFEILQALNRSFYTKSEHISVNIDNTQYVIPSFLSLENKLSTLEDNFENLVNAPKTGEAVFDFDGNTQSIEVKGFTNVPNKAFDGVDIENVAANMTKFEYKKNEIFKDFLTPTPYIKIDLSQIPNDIQQVNVKKVIINNEQLLNLLKTDAKWQTADPDTGVVESVCRPINYANVVKKLYAFEDTVDYVTYDKVYSMPIRYELGSGKYSIEKIVSNWTDGNFEEHYELQLDHLTYKIADETIERNFYEGDYLITNNDKVKLLIEKVYSSTNTVQVKVENGGYADLCTVNDGNVDLSTLKFFAIGNIRNSKYLDIPLEEDRYVLVFLAPIQRNSLVQSPWGEGLFFDVYALTNKDGVNYKSFYNQIVTNIGDKLFGIVSLAEEDFVNTTEIEFNKLTKTKPVINSSDFKVTLINKHMSNSETISEIYNLYKQKESYKNELSSVQKQIDEINALLSSLSFEDTTTSRTIYTDQLMDLNSRKKDITASIANCIQQITIASTDTDTPVENPKYHIRGFFNFDNYLKTNNLNSNVIKIEVQYRYKNANRATGNAETIATQSQETAIFSDWNDMYSAVRTRYPKYEGGGIYKYYLEDDTTEKNVPSFNQLDIPISQGETVDIRLRVVYAIGYPFVKTTSAWSDIVNVEFPVELRKNVTVLDIIKENNSDTTKEAFRGYLDKYGVVEHVSDKLVDQNITYFHQPEHIASGFYTEERRVIPLRDKLQTLTNEMITLKDEVFGLNSDNIIITLSDGESEVILNANADNSYTLKDYASSDKITYMYDHDKDPTTEDIESDEHNPKVETTLILKIQNNSETSALKLYSMFPGNYNYAVATNTQSKFDTSDIVVNSIKSTQAAQAGSASRAIGGSGAFGDIDLGVGGTVTGGTIAGGTVTQQKNSNKLCVPLYVDDREGSDISKFTPQVLNQWMYFTIDNIYNGEYFYKGEATKPDYMDKKMYGYCDSNYNITNTMSSIIYPKFFSNDSSKIENGGCGMCVFPHLSTIKDICITEMDSVNYKIVYPGDSIEIPLTVMFTLNETYDRVTKTMSFNLRNSLFSDPINYKFDIIAKYSNDLSNNTRRVKKVRYNAVIVD